MQKSGHPHFWVDIISQSFILKFNYKHAKKQIEKGPLKFIKKEILFQLNLMHIVSWNVNAKAEIVREGIIFLIYLFARAILLLKKVENQRN